MIKGAIVTCLVSLSVEVFVVDIPVKGKVLAIGPELISVDFSKSAEAKDKKYLTDLTAPVLVSKNKCVVHN